MDEYNAVHGVVAPRIRAYFKDHVDPGWKLAQEHMGTFMATKFYEGDPRATALRNDWKRLTDEMDLAESKVSFAYSGIGERTSATNSAREAITRVSNLLRNYTGAESLRHYLSSLDHRLSSGAIQHGIAGAQ